jgi:hypothetical protein
MLDVYSMQDEIREHRARGLEYLQQISDKNTKMSSHYNSRGRRDAGSQRKRWEAVTETGIFPIPLQMLSLVCYSG